MTAAEVAIITEAELKIKLNKSKLPGIGEVLDIFFSIINRNKLEITLRMRPETAMMDAMMEDNRDSDTNE